MTKQLTDSFIYEDKEFCIIAIENSWPFNIESLGVRPIPSGTDCLRGHYCKYNIENGELFIKDLYLSLDGEYPVINGVSCEDTYEYDESFEEEFDNNDENESKDEFEKEVINDFKEKVIDNIEEKNIDLHKENNELIELDIREENSFNVLVDDDKELDEINKDEDLFFSYDYDVELKVYKDINLSIEYSGRMIIGSNYMDKKYGVWFMEPYGFVTVYEIILLNGKVEKIIDRKKDMRMIRKEIRKKDVKSKVKELGLNRYIKEQFNLDYDINLWENEGYIL